MQLRLAITDLYGVTRARLDRYTDAQVVVPWNDARTAQVSLSIHDIAASHVLPLERMLKCWLVQDDSTVDLVFWGPIITPTWTLDEDKVEVAAHDMGIRLKHHYLNQTDSAVVDATPTDFKGSVPVSFVGMRRLRDAGVNGSGENADSVPDLGILNGKNTHPGAARQFAQSTTLGQSFPASFLEVADDTDFPTSGTVLVGATIGAAPGYDLSGTLHTLTYTGKDPDNSTTLTGVTGWSGSGSLASGVSAIVKGSGKAKRMLAERGENVWDKMQELAQLPTGPDYELLPYDGGTLAPASSANESADVPKTIATSASVGLRAQSDIVVTDPGYLEKMTVSVWIERVETDDITLILQSPDGSQMYLVERTEQPLSGANYGTGSGARTVFDDGATNAITDGVPPYVGTYTPFQNMLNHFGNRAVAGTWTLFVYAGPGAASAGTLHNWKITFAAVGTPPVTPPYAKLCTYDKVDLTSPPATPGDMSRPADRRATAQFIYGFGRENAQAVKYTPGGDLVRNRVVAVTANSGADAGGGKTKTAVRSNLASRQRYGNYVQWEATGVLDKAASPQDTLKDVAEYWLESLAFPPQTIELSPRTAPADGGLPGLLRYMRDFRAGDLVRLALRRGNVQLLDPSTGAPTAYADMVVREVRLAQADDVGNLDTQLTCVPFVPAPPTPDEIDTA